MPACRVVPTASAGSGSGSGKHLRLLDNPACSVRTSTFTTTLMGSVWQRSRGSLKSPAQPGHPPRESARFPGVRGPILSERLPRPKQRVLRDLQCSSRSLGQFKSNEAWDGQNGSRPRHWSEFGTTSVQLRVKFQERKPVSDAPRSI